LPRLKLSWLSTVVVVTARADFGLLMEVLYPIPGGRDPNGI